VRGQSVFPFVEREIPQGHRASAGLANGRTRHGVAAEADFTRRSRLERGLSGHAWWKVAEGSRGARARAERRGIGEEACGG
jgi:hypothetical protein